MIRRRPSARAWTATSTLAAAKWVSKHFAASSVLAARAQVLAARAQVLAARAQVLAPLEAGKLAQAREQTMPESHRTEKEHSVVALEGGREGRFCWKRPSISRVTIAATCGDCGISPESR